MLHSSPGAGVIDCCEQPEPRDDARVIKFASTHSYTQGHLSGSGVFVVGLN